MNSADDHIDFRGASIEGNATGKVEHHHHGPAPTATSSLPAAPVTFTGREAETSHLLAALNPGTEQRDPVLISALAGLGGIGKTALALHVAHRARDNGWFPGGTLFIDLHGYDPDPVTADQAVQSLLRAFGIRDTDLPPTPDGQYALYRTVLAQLADSDQAALIILDNVSEPEQAAALLPNSPRHRTLITSRDALESLPARLHRLEELTPPEAAALIHRQLQLVDPTDRRGIEEPKATRELAAKCGRLPLALNIAAALLRRRRHRGIATLVEELEAATDRPGTLRTRGVDQYGRPLALGPVFDVSYRRLTPDQARLFRLIAQAPDSTFSLGTAGALAEQSVSATAELLDDLSASFLIAPTTEATSGLARWQMLDLVRGYAQGVTSGEKGLQEDAQEARGRLLEHLYRWAAAADDHLRGLPGDELPDVFAGRAEAQAWLDAERPSLVGAALWAGHPGGEEWHAAQALFLGLRLVRSLNLRRYFEEGRAVSLAARDAAIRLGMRDAEAMACDHLGLVLQELRQFDKAVDAHTHARDLHTALDDGDNAAGAWYNLGNALHRLRRFDEALDAHTHAHALYTALGDRHGTVMALNGLGNILCRLRRFDEGVDALTLARDLSTTLGDKQTAATAVNGLGLALIELRRFAHAVDAFTRARDLFISLDDQHGTAGAWNNLGLALRETRRLDDAVRAHVRARDLYVSLDDQHGTAGALNNLGVNLQMLRRFEEAVVAHTRARDLFISLDDQHGTAGAWNNLGLALQRLRLFGEALVAFRCADEACVRLDDWYGAGQKRMNIANLLTDMDSPDEARTAWAAAAEAYTNAGAEAPAAEARHLSES